MKRRPFGPLAVSIAVHAVIVVALARMVFTYQLGNVDGLPREPAPKEQLRFFRVTPSAPATSGGGQQLKRATARDRTPAPLLPPSAIPTTIPVPIGPIPPAVQAAGGTGTGRSAGVGAGAATGIVPLVPDPRIRLTLDPGFPVTRTPTETIDSIISRSYGIVLDSVAAEAARRKPGDWTFTDKDGRKYGWDPSGIHLGKFTLPNALLALLPLNNLQANPTFNSREAAAIRFDVMYHGQAAITEDEFRESVKRIRERKEREHQEELKKKAAGKDSSASGPGSN